ncbi:MAG: hypothetical protein AAB614_01120 [Patescibacteria group bacterium]
MFIASFLIFFSSISFVLKLAFALKFRLFIFSLVAALIISESYWLISKLPLNFVTSGFVIFVIYYAIWDITIRYFAGNLTKKSIYFILALLVLTLSIIFITIKLL